MPSLHSLKKRTHNSPWIGLGLAGVVMGLLIAAFLPNGTGQGAAAETPESHQTFLPIIFQNYTISAGWLEILNGYRGSAGLPALSEDAELSQADWYHARYMVKNDLISHSEDTANPWYTETGSTAAMLSGLMISSTTATTDEQAMDTWMKAPFHAVGLLDPQLLRVGFGSFREADASMAGVEMAAAIDMVSGLGSLPASVSFPIFWPADGSSVPYARMTNEIPDPLASCGYESPAGLPIILQLGAGELTPQVSAHSLKQGTTSLAHCVFTESTYSNPDASYREKGRAILDERDAVVIIPQEPLVVGGTYTVSVSTNLGSYTWSFTVSDDR